MSELNTLKKLNKRSKILTITSIIILVISIIFFIVATTMSVNTMSNGWYYGDYPQSTTDYIIYLVIAIILLLAYWIYTLVVSILVLVSSASINSSPNKTLYLVMAILGMVLLGVISYIVIWVVSSNELKNSNNNQTPYDTPVPPSNNNSRPPIY